jgi:DNA-binding NarL/FixJ family response regulator
MTLLYQIAIFPVVTLNEPFERDFWITDRGREQLNKHVEPVESLYELLTRREQQIFRMLAEGMNYKEIASWLGISAKTVNVHKAQLMVKLRLNTQNDLFRLGLKLEIITV